MPVVLEKQVSIADFKARISEFAEDIAKGNSIVVTRYNKPVFKAVPADAIGREPKCKGMLAAYADTSKISLEHDAWEQEAAERAAYLA